MIQLDIINIRLCEKLFHLHIAIGDGEVTLRPKTQLIEFGKFTLGNDDEENEMILFPGSFSFSFRIKNDSDYMVVRDALTINNTVITVYQGTDGVNPPFYKGKMQLEQISRDNQLKVISAVFYDDTAILSNSTYSHANSPEYIKVFELSSDQFGQYWSGITIESRLQFKASEYFVGLNDIYGIIYADGPYYYNKTSNGMQVLYNYSTIGDVFKTLLNTFASYAIVGFNSELLILPRWYDGRGKRDLSDVIIAGGDTLYFSKKFDGLILNVKFRAAVNGETNYHAYKVGNVEFKNGTTELLNPDLVETIYFYCGLDGTEGAGSRLLFYSPEPYITDINLDDNGASFLTILNNSQSYSPRLSLKQMVANIIFSNIGVNRKKYTVEVTGTDYSFKEYYSVPLESAVFRPVKIIYDFVKDRTELTLIECPTIKDQALTSW